MKRFLIVVGYAVGGLVLAGVVSLGAFAVTTRQLSETPEPISIGHTASLAPTADSGGQGGGGNGQDDTAGNWRPSWSPTASPSDSPSDDPSPDETTTPRARAPRHSGSGDDDHDDSSGPGSGDDDADDD